ncbi:hypothetical protein DN752_12015 [Echinicola strongylocentroti]|uniref:Uncharacterized protein n=1 Tax=Echinicola strongylocentroti TaxID=1795355 RepID=A0A2Z4II37_9BACT|nr:hypothetical protein [Echinicola strongylocentroti]AWW30791.1 hypothetical protein DN752_12015 [Echinicola strongylocentroti]
MKDKNKLTKKQFKAVTSKYKNEVGSGKPGLGVKGEITDQTRWIWFERELIEKVLKQTDETTGGIKFYFGEYDESFSESLGEEYVGRMMLAMVPCNEADLDKKAADVERLEAVALTEDDEEEEDAENGGRLCPPHC